MAFHCQNKRCNKQQPFPSCPQISVGNLSVHSVNCRAAFAMRCFGGDLAELETFCGVMDLPPPVQKCSHNLILTKQYKSLSTCEVQESSMKRAGETEYLLGIEEEDQHIANIDVSFDGTYMTRGHSLTQQK